MEADQRNLPRLYQSSWSRARHLDRTLRRNGPEMTKSRQFSYALKFPAKFHRHNRCERNNPTRNRPRSCAVRPTPPVAAHATPKRLSVRVLASASASGSAANAPVALAITAKIQTFPSSTGPPSPIRPIATQRLLMMTASSLLATVWELHWSLPSTCPARYPPRKRRSRPQQ